MLRALRPLRLISRYPKLRLVVNSILGAVPRVANVAVINLLFMVIFGIIGVQVGTFSRSGGRVHPRSTDRRFAN